MAASKWEALTRCRRFQSAVQQLQGELRTCHKENDNLTQDIARLHAKAQAAALDIERLHRRSEDLQKHHEEERQSLAQRHVKLMQVIMVVHGTCWF